MSAWGAAPLAAIALALSPTTARADRCPPPSGASAELAQHDAATRYRYLRAALSAEQRKGELWNRAWGWGLLGSTAGSLGVGLLEWDDECVDCWFVTAGKSALGVLSTFVLNPVRIETPPPVAGTPSCQQLARAERALNASAASERVHWFRHVEGFAVNLAATLYIGLELDDWYRATLSFAGGFVVGELRLYTRPDGAIRAQRGYRAGELGASAAAPRAWMIAPLIADDAYGLSLAFEL